jgi:hypothetical protein
MLHENIPRSCTPKISIVSPCDLARFSLFQIILPKIDTVSPSCAICNMMYDAYAMQNDVMMLCYVIDICSEDTHIYPYNIFVSTLSFRCKLCIPLGTTLELLHLLLRRYKLCIPLGTSLELLRLLLRRYKLCIPLGTSLELLHLFSFGTRWCVLSFYIYILWGILLL